MTESLESRKHGLQNTITSNEMVLRKFRGEPVTFDEGKALYAAEVAMNGALDIWPDGITRPNISLERAHDLAKGVSDERVLAA